MFSCDHLSHPFQNDPGTSQEERTPAGLLGGDTPIDGRQLSDLLNYFTTLATQINFYNTDMSVGSWKPFFQKNLPFLLSAISSYSGDPVKTKMASVIRLFQKHPSPDGLQLLFLQSYYTAIYPLQQWSLGLTGSGLDLEMTLQTLIRDRLVQPVQDYIRWANTAAHCFGIQPPAFNELQSNTVWGLTADDLTAYEPDFPCAVKSRRSQLLAVQSALSALVDNFTDVLDLATPGAADIVNDPLSLVNLLSNNGQQDTPPHLALLFSFLTQYLNVQADLNTLPKKHLDFFFQDVLSLAPGNAVPDNAYVVFTLQKQLPNYTIKANTLLKAGKDSLGTDVLFGVNEDSTITQTQVTSLRTVFVNQQGQGDQAYTQGVYMAPDATMADGVSKPFKDPSNAAWPAGGAEQSLYTPPGAAGPIDYPSARLGFILASKVLLMKEGKRKVEIQLACEWSGLCTNGPAFSDLFPLAQDLVKSRWLLITADLLTKAGTMGVSAQTIQNLTDHYLQDPCRKSLCGGQKVFYLDQALVQMHDIPKKPDCPDEFVERTNLQKKEGFWKTQMTAVGGVAPFEEEILKQVFSPQTLFNVTFSGEKAWLSPDYMDMELVVPTGSDAGTFIWNIDARLGPEQLPVAFYNPTALGEDFDATDPMVKIQLNDTIKMALISSAGTGSTGSCLEIIPDTCGQQMSAYEFFRNIELLKALPTDSSTTSQIQVTVCGVTSLVVQNDDNVLDGNKNFAPFGMKPVIVDFDKYPVVQPDSTGLNLIGPTFLIGSAEIFLKKWDQLFLNIDWVGKPSDFDAYYKVYTEHPFGQSRANLTSPGHQVNLALLNGGNWYQEGAGSTAATLTPAGSISDYNRQLFPDSSATSTGNTTTGDSTTTGPIGFAACCQNDFQYTFSIAPDNFDGLPPLAYDPNFTPFTKYSTGQKSGFLRLTLEYQDFLHKIYPWVLSRQIIEQANHKGRHIHSPNEPWTPMIQKGMSIDYSATATLNDISLIQLYPFEGTYNAADIAGEPPLFATFCDEGNLFIGLTGLVPGETLNILFQLAEATGETENASGTLTWFFLAGNTWQELRSGFEILQDDTNALTTTGIIQFAFPDTISNDNTLLDSGQYWIRASLTQNTAAGSRIQGVVTQAVATTYAPQTGNDPQRAATPLANGTITKLLVPDGSVQKLNQPYASFGGSAPEISGTAYYLRVSEQMRHKGRAVQKWDYERLVLQQFPQILRAKCINHSTALNSNSYRMDFPMSPGNVVVAVIPDINQLAVADNLQPMVPASLLTSIETFLATKVSPFVQVAARNPRYEPVDMCITVIPAKGSEFNVVQAQLQTDLQNELAPWIGGDTTNFQFAQRLYLSDLVGFVESRDYISSLTRLLIARHGEPMGQPAFIDPLTPRSILVAGTIEVGEAAHLNEQNAFFWKKRATK